MDAVTAFQNVLGVQRAFEILAALALTANLFPKQAQVQDFQKFDMIIVGAGSAGTTVALRLAECNFKVLLIDAGGDPPLPSVIPALFGYMSHTEVDWNYTNVHKHKFLCHRHQTLHLTSGHVLGGGSSINDMFYVRGCPGDFRFWAEAANHSSWDYDGMLPFFVKSERLEDIEILSSRYRKYHGTKGFLGVTRELSPKLQKYFEAFNELGNDILLDINGDRSFGYTPQLYTIAEGVRQSTGYSILSRYKNLVNLKILKHTFVTKILFDENNNAIGVRATTKDNKQITLKARHEVILSAGAFNTPRLLMLSGIGPREHLKSLNISVRQNLPVGKNLQDHVCIPIYFKMEESNKPTPPIDPHKFVFPTFTGYVGLNKSQECPTYQAINFLVPAGSKSPVEQCVLNYGFEFDICQKLYEGSKNRNIMYTTITLLHPESRGYMLLRSINPRDKPLIDIGYFEDDRDVKVLVDSAIDFVRVLNTTYFRSVRSEIVDMKLKMCEGLNYMSRKWWQCYVRCLLFTAYHYSGTCEMGKVVDNKLRVFGLGKLRIIDASVMPRLVGANTNAAVIAIGEKGADIIKKEYS